MASNMEPGGEQPFNFNGNLNLIEILPELLIDSPMEDVPMMVGNQTPERQDHQYNIINVLTPEEEETNVTIAHNEVAKPPTPVPNLNSGDGGTPYLTFQEWFTPIDVEHVDQMDQQIVPTTPRHAAIFALDTEFHSEDPLQTWPYAMEAFMYQRDREASFILKDYMPHQPDLSPWKRTLLVSWMVSVHQTFGTFRETLFLAVKIFDHYLCRFIVEESSLQLLGAAAIFIAAKFEEKEVLSIDSLLQSCYWAYTGRDLLQMERETLCGLEFDLGIPISYRFLRRYARSAMVLEPIWTLASYILELNLMEYSTVGNSDSQMACAALFLALRMCGLPEELDELTWDAMLVYYSGYQLPEFAWLVPVLNAILHRSGDCESAKEVRALYSRPMLYEVADVPLLTDEEVFRHNPELYNGA